MPPIQLKNVVHHRPPSDGIKLSQDVEKGDAGARVLIDEYLKAAGAEKKDNHPGPTSGALAVAIEGLAGRTIPLGVLEMELLSRGFIRTGCTWGVIFNVKVERPGKGA